MFSLNDDANEFLSEEIRNKNYSKNEIIYSKGEQSNGVFIINKGSVILNFIDSDGREIRYKQCIEGEWFGFVSEVSKEKIRLASAVCNEESSIGYLSSSSFYKLLKKDNNFQFEIYDHFASYLQHLSDLYSGSVNSSLYERTESMLNKLCEWNNSKELNLSQYELASYLGVSKEALGVQLNKMKSDGVIILGYKKIKYLK